MGKKEEKTNVMRILDGHNIKYSSFVYDNRLLDALSVADFLGADANRLFKTLVTCGKSGGYLVFMIPAGYELDLKKAAAAANEKFIQMLPQKELFNLTGYVHGGCSPIGMKKQLTTFIDLSAENFEWIYFSGGRVGCQVEVKLNDLKRVIEIIPADLCQKGRK